jgi:hypothetical protein
MRVNKSGPLKLLILFFTIICTCADGCNVSMQIINGVFVKKREERAFV